ncbi:MAG TPA: hypothetical protein VHA13_00655 [Gammaproteobacteria bacterium]|nr:hypothetical protein [Gammaproteobacteria bacterium]
MFERMQKPFLTVETGEAYQPIRLTYHVADMDKLVAQLNSLKCIEKHPSGNWNWFWRDEVEEIHFESLDTFQRSSQNTVRLGTFAIRDDQLYLNLPSFKRACLAVPFFHQVIDPAIAQIQHADFLNKVYGQDERLPHGFAEIFKDEELNALLDQRIKEYNLVQQQCENAASVEEAIALVTEYTNREANKKLPFAERYEFDLKPGQDADLIFLGFYIFLRGRELVAIRRWFGETSYTLADATDEAIEQVFGDVGVDIIE